MNEFKIQPSIIENNFIPLDLAVTKANISEKDLTQVNFIPNSPERLIDLSKDDIHGKVAENIQGARNYDAVVDKNGKGDFIDIKSAIDAGKKTIFVRAGIYTATNTITISANIIIIGEDTKNTEITCTDSSSTTFLAVTGRLQMANLTLKRSAGDGYLVSWTGAFSVLSNCIFYQTHATGKAVYANGADGRVESCNFPDTRRGVQVGSSGDRTQIVNNYFTTNSSVNSTPIYMHDEANQISVINNTIICQRSTEGNTALIYVGDCDEVIISNNILDNNSGSKSNYGIHTNTGASSPQQLKILGNTFKNLNRGANIASYYGTIINANHFINLEYQGIRLDQAGSAGYGHHLITNNYFREIVGSGIYTVSRFDFGIISNNTFYHCGNTGGAYAIALGEHCYNSKFSDNVIQACGGGITTASTYNLYQCSITGNIIQDCTNSGIYLANVANHCIINNNILKDNGYGLYQGAGGMINSSICNNSVHSNTSGGIISHNADLNYCTIIGNTIYGNGSNGLLLQTRYSVVAANCLRDNTQGYDDDDGLGTIINGDNYDNN